MNTEVKNYRFKTDIGSIYQMFWFTHDLLEECPETDLNFEILGTATLVEITNTRLSYPQIKSIFFQNVIECEKIED